MPEAWLRKVVLIAITSAVLAALVHVFRGDPAPQFAGPRELHLVPTVAPSPAPTTEPSGTWVEPIDGACPPGFPVKAKLSSVIFHVPGALSYDRTNPDCCYPTPEAAEADSLRAAKR